MKFKLLSTLFLVSTIVSICAYAEINKNDFIIKIGLLKSTNNDWLKGFDEDRYIVYKETTQIPYMAGKKDADFGFGYTLYTKSGKPFYHRATLAVPEPKNISSQFMEKLPNGRASHVGTNVLNSRGYLYYWMGYEEGDQPGLYTVDVFINDELLRTINFNVGLHEKNKDTH